MSAPVDVLKLLRYHARISTSTWGPDNQDADALSALEELIEVASLFDGYVAADMGDTSLLDNEALWDRLHAALARVKGA